VDGTTWRPLRTLVCLLAACGVAAGAASARPVAAGPAAGRGDVLQAGPPGTELTLTPAAGAPRLARADGRGVALELPEGAAPTAVAALAEGWAVAGTRPDGGGGTRLFFVVGSAGRTLPLAPPPGRGGAVRRDPVLLVDGGRLAGAAWLEGDATGRLGVRAAAFDGERWGAPEPVAPPGPGSQLALAGAVLDDGSWLLAWSAFDGGDDEIVWAQRLGGSWLPAARLGADNAVPDITPALAATAGGGAVAAWSRYDGREYRLRTARFERGEWRLEEWAGSAGSLFPSFAGTREKPWLLYRDARAAGWAVAEVAPAGEERTLPARRLAADTPSERPAVIAEDGAPLLVWPAAGDGSTLRVRPRASGAAEGGR
jgi:hypothetical protein